MSREKKWGNKKGRNLQSKWKILASVWVLMLAFLLVPGMKSEAAAKTKISAPKSVKMYFTTGENYMGSTMSTLSWTGLYFREKYAQKRDDTGTFLHKLKSTMQWLEIICFHTVAIRMESRSEWIL